MFLSWDVLATSDRDAVNEVLDGCGELVHTEYSYTPASWGDTVKGVRHVSCEEE